MSAHWTGPEQLDPAWRAGLLGPGKMFELVDEDVLGATLPEVRAVIVVHPGASVSPEAVRVWVGETLARHKVPTVVDVVDQLPRNETGKVLKAHLTDPAASPARMVRGPLDE